MKYNLASLSNEQITNLYLYGQPDTPSDLSSDTLIRGSEVADIDPAFTVVSLTPLILNLKINWMPPDNGETMKLTGRISRCRCNPSVHE